jgi:glycosyltransferase involved in cell wall biosynthesis
MAVPLVSVIIPAYRASADIGDALASVFAQRFADYEVIVINDGSPDTPELEAAIAPFRSHLCYIVQPNRGAAAARNTGIAASRGDYVALLDADDRWLPEFLASQVDYLAGRPPCALVYADAHISGESALNGRRFMEQAPSDGPVTLVSLLQQRCNVPLSTVVARRAAVIAAGGFDERLRRGHDADLWFRMALLGYGIGYQRTVLAERRVRAEGLSGTAVAELTRAIRVLDHFDRQHELPVEAKTALRISLNQLISRLELERGKQRLAEGDVIAARQHLSASRERSLKVIAVRLLLRVAPRVMERVYRAMREPLSVKTDAGVTVR